MNSKIYLIVLIIAMPLLAENWPGWRGPSGNGISQANMLPNSWSAETNIDWRLPLEGPAASTPVLWEDKIFLTSTKGDDFLVMAVSTDGKVLWEEVVGTGNKSFRQGESNYAAPSPSTDGSNVFAFFGNGDLVSFSIDGKQVWKRNLADEFGAFNMYFGMASSPLLHNGSLFVLLLHSDAQLVLSIDKATGETLWKHDRKTSARRENLHSYASPMIYSNDAVSQLIIHGSDVVTGHSLKNGAEIWRCGGLQDPDNYNDFLRFVATPVTDGTILVVPSAKNGPILGLQPDKAEGTITGNKQYYAWRWDANTTDVPSPLIHVGLVYICRENGVLICIDAATGEEVYKKSVYRKRHRSSLVYGDGKIYISAMDGTISVVAAGRDYKLLAQNKF